MGGDIVTSLFLCRPQNNCRCLNGSRATSSWRHDPVRVRTVNIRAHWTTALFGKAEKQMRSHTSRTRQLHRSGVDGILQQRKSHLLVLPLIHLVVELTRTEGDWSGRYTPDSIHFVAGFLKFMPNCSSIIIHFERERKQRLLIHCRVVCDAFSCLFHRHEFRNSTKGMNSNSAQFHYSRL